MGRSKHPSAMTTSEDLYNPKVKRAKSSTSATYKPTNILVTGGAGFIASHVVIRLVKKYPDCKVVCLDKVDYCSSIRNLDEVKDCPNFKFIKGNICSADLVRYVLEQEQIDTIIHAAAQTHVDNSFGNSFAFTENNVLGTHVLLESAKNTGCIKRFIHVSTDEVYGSSYQDEGARQESDTLEPTNPYAATKAAAEAIARSYWFSFKMPVIVTRGNNVFGPHQYPEKVIPKFIRRLMNGMPVCIHSGVDGEVYNIGCDDEFTNLEVAERLVKEMRPGIKEATEHIEFVADRPFNDVRYFINSEKLMALGWKTEVSFEDGLAKTIAWYRTVTKDWWDIGTDSALAAHPAPLQQQASLKL